MSKTEELARRILLARDGAENVQSFLENRYNDLHGGDTLHTEALQRAVGEIKRTVSNLEGTYLALTGELPE